MVNVLDPQSTNATATFYEHAPDPASTGPDDPDSDDWQPLNVDVPVLYDAQAATFATVETGDMVVRQDRVFAPLAVADDHEKGDRIDVTHRGDTHRLRIVEAAERTFDGRAGVWELAVEDMGD